MYSIGMKGSRVRVRLLPWKHLFGSLSLPQFKLVSDLLDFPVEPTDELRQLGHDFVVAYYTFLGRHLREPVSVNLLEGISPDNTRERQAEIIFANTFSHLDRMGCAKAIHDWSKTDTGQYPSEDVRQLFLWFILLMRWLVLEQHKHPISPEQTSDSSDWDLVLTKWVPVYTLVPPEGFTSHILEPLEIGAATRAFLQSVIFQAEAKYLRLETLLEPIFQSATDGWGAFVLRTGGCYTWMNLEGQFRTQLWAWKRIAARLTPDELRVLEQWLMKDTKFVLKGLPPSFTPEPDA